MEEKEPVYLCPYCETVIDIDKDTTVTDESREYGYDIFVCSCCDKEIIGIDNLDIEEEK